MPQLPKPKTATPSQAVPLTTWAPDRDPTSDGIIIDAFNVYPIARGFRTFPGLQVLGTGLPSKCFGNFSGIVNGTPLFMGATASSLYLLSAANNLVPVTGGTGFTNTKNRWRFAPYGTPTATPFKQYLFACNGTDPIQFYDPAVNAFAPVPNGSSDSSAPPLISSVFASDYSAIFIVANSSTFISSLNAFPPTWNISGISPGSVPLQVYVQPLLQTKGNITAGGKLRDTIVLYKPNAMHVGYFAGGTVGWQMETISDQYGVLSQEWVVNTGDYHFFPTLTHDFWQFDGWNLTRLPNDMAEFFREDHNDAFMSTMVGAYDSIRELVVWAYSSNSANPAGTIDTWLIYYLRRPGAWSFQRLPVEMLTTYLNPTTLHSFLGFFAPNDHAAHIYTEGVAPQRSYVTSQYYGDGHWLYETQRVRPVFTLYPQSAALFPINQDVPGAIWGPPGDVGLTEVTGGIPLESDGWFNVNNASRWQAHQIVMQGMAEIQSLEPILVFAGEA